MRPRSIPFIAALALAIPVAPVPSSAEETTATFQPRQQPPAASPDLDLTEASVNFHTDLDLLVFRVQVEGRAGATNVEPAGQIDGAPVLGYVFPTDLASTDIGFAAVEGVVALAVTAHPDFDDTPLWDENNDGLYDNDGVTWHTHWVVLGPDERVAGGLAVKQIAEEEMATVLPPTNPGMPLYMDSPGYSVLTGGAELKVLVPRQRVNNRSDFHFDAVTAYMEVDTRGEAPLLGVYEVYEVLSGDLSLPYTVTVEPASGS